jgi:hypothetical protein
LEFAHNDQKKLVPGYVTTATTIRIAETLLDKPGGYLSNDMSPHREFTWTISPTGNSGR